MNRAMCGLRVAGWWGRVGGALLLGALLGAAPLSARAAVAFAQGDHVCLIGNALGDRMQHDGWLETLIQHQHPRRALVIRDLAYCGDQVAKQPRIEGSPTLEDYLALCRADVIICFFGYNESFAGTSGVARFSADYTALLRRFAAAAYNGKGAPRLVLCSPIAFENLGRPGLPDGAAHNERLAAYARAVAGVAAANGAGYIDLFAASQALYAASEAPLTLDGAHLTEEGNRQLAEVIASALSGAPARADAALEKLRQAVLDKSDCWLHRYHAPNGNDIWGSRSVLRFVDGQSNADVLQPELVQLDVMTANRDRRIWAVAAGGDAAVDDRNLPPPVKVVSNVGGGSPSSSARKEGTAEYIGGEEAIAQMTVARGFEVGLFADEQRFPELANPVQLAVDPRGRLWVAAWPTYPSWQPGSDLDDRLLILPDADRDGRADRCITFAHVRNPTGFEFWNGGVVVASPPDLLFLKDTNGDDVADVCIHLLQGLEAADTHHAPNGFVYGPDGALYWQRGVFIVENVETPWGPAHASGAPGLYRFDPRRFTFNFHAAIGPNPHGTSFDYWGAQFATDGTSGNAFQVVPEGRGFAMRDLFQKTVRPVPASGIISSAQFPPENQQNFMVCNVIGFLGIKQYRLDRDPVSGFANGVEVEPLVYSADKNFRPTDVEFGEDGALYFADWHNRIIGHMQHNARDPSRDHRHGRVYRMLATGRPLQAPVPIAGAPVAALMRNLEHPVDGVRYRTRIELSARDPGEVLQACRDWMKAFDPKKKEDAHALLEALWVHQREGARPRELLDRLLASPEPRARVAAATVKQHWDVVDATRDDAAAAPRREEAKPVSYGPTRRLGAADQRLYEQGRAVYHREAHCVTCHQADGRGLPQIYPPLAGSPWVNRGAPDLLVKIALHGLWGPLDLNGARYANSPPMTPFRDLLKDEEVAAVLTYVRNSWGNTGPAIAPADVRRVRAETSGRSQFWQPEELLRLHPLPGGPGR